jgi:hypothetical protein
MIALNLIRKYFLKLGSRFDGLDVTIFEEVTSMEDTITVTVREEVYDVAIEKILDYIRDVAPMRLNSRIGYVTSNKHDVYGSIQSYAELVGIHGTLEAFSSEKMFLLYQCDVVFIVDCLDVTEADIMRLWNTLGRRCKLVFLDSIKSSTYRYLTKQSDALVRYKESFDDGFSHLHITANEPILRMLVVEKR